MGDAHVRERWSEKRSAKRCARAASVYTPADADFTGSGPGTGPINAEDTVKSSETLGQLADAMAKAQQAFTPVVKDTKVNTGKFGFKFAPLPDCLVSVLPALNANGLTMLQPVRIEKIDGVFFAVCTTMIVHVSGEWFSEDFAVSIEDINNAQKIGTAASYARRYGALGGVCHAAVGEDDDGASSAEASHRPETNVYGKRGSGTGGNWP